MSKTVLITGANGFLARALAARLPAEWRLLGLVRSGDAPGDGRWQGWFRDESSLAAAPDVDIVVHLAARIPPNIADADPDLLRSNVLLPAALVLRYPSARHVLASSVSVYGVPESLPLRISSPLLATSPYGLSKIAAEAVVRQARSHAVLRYSSIVGRGMRDRTFVPAMVRAARAGTMVVYGDGSRLQDYIDVRDAAEICFRAMTRDDNLVTLAVSARAISNADLARELAGITGAAVTFAGSDASASYRYDLAGAVALAPCQHTLRETLKDMVQE